MVGLVALAGCGSSKPGYCTNRSNLENSIKGLTSLNVGSGLTGLQSQLKKIETDASSLVNSAGQIATVASAASSVVSSVKSFTDATSSKCS